jgi:hypothetical protein
MKQTLLVVIAAAAMGAATAVLLTHRPAPPARSAAPVRLDETALERALVCALETVGFGRQARSAPVAPPEAGERSPAEADEEVSTHVRRTTMAESLPPTNLAAVGTLKSFDKDEQLRRTWMFRSERDVIDWLGMPQRAFAYGGGERWVYRLPDGKERVLELHRGRLLNVFD